jgi:hypothetical protein
LRQGIGENGCTIRFGDDIHGAVHDYLGVIGAATAVEENITSPTIKLVPPVAKFMKRPP